MAHGSHLYAQAREDCFPLTVEAVPSAPRSTYGAWESMVHAATDIATAKRELRRAALARRAAAAVGAAEAGAALADTFVAAIAPAAGAVVAGYWPIRDEIDPRPLLGRLHAAAHPCALCATVERRAALRFRAWQPGAVLERGAFGTWALPAEAREVVPEIVLTPLLAFDARGHRLGYGGGYYDRTIAGLRGQGDVLAVGLAFEVQRVEHVPNAAGDVRLDWVVTEVRARRTA